mgnify:FL=1
MYLVLGEELFVAFCEDVHSGEVQVRVPVHIGEAVDIPEALCPGRRPRYRMVSLICLLNSTNFRL